MSQASRGEISGCFGVNAELSKTSRTIQLASTGCVRVGNREVIYVNGAQEVNYLTANEAMAGGSSDEVWDGSLSRQGRMVSRQVMITIRVGASEGVDLVYWI